MRQHFLKNRQGLLYGHPTPNCFGVQWSWGESQRQWVGRGFELRLGGGPSQLLLAVLPWASCLTCLNLGLPI